MSCFIKYFLIGIVIQAAFLVMTFTFPVDFIRSIGGVVTYILYAGPYILIYPLHQTKLEISIYILALIPIIIYSIIIGLAVCLARKIKNNENKKMR